MKPEELYDLDEILHPLMLDDFTKLTDYYPALSLSESATIAAKVLLCLGGPEVIIMNFMRFLCREGGVTVEDYRGIKALYTQTIAARQKEGRP